MMSNLKVSVIGCGYLGAVHAACMAQLGHTVIGVDVDEQKVEMLTAGEAPFYEPGFEELLRAGLDSGRLTFTTASASALKDVDIHFIGVGTPQSADSGAADLSYVNSAVDMIIEAAALSSVVPVVVGKSTVPVGTAQGLADRLEPLGMSLVWNPEFLRESMAIKDTLEPDRIVYGLSENKAHATRGRAMLDRAFQPILNAGTPLVVTSYPTSELVKVAANAFLATKISYINAMAEFCEHTGGDVADLALALGMDERIGPKFLRAGVGYGGGCLPKDVRAFSHRAEELGLDDTVSFLHHVDTINLHRRDRVVALAHEILGEVTGKKITILGATFKPNTDDLRDSPAIDIARRLHQAGAHVTITDPQGLDNVNAQYPKTHTETDTAAALQDAELTIVLTEWPEYANLDPQQTHSLVASPVLIDGRQCLNPTTWANAGWAVHSLGRPTHAGVQ